MFLSRLILDPSSRQVRSELAHPYEMHKTLMCAFPKATDEKKAKARDEFSVLFRADVDDRRERVIVYVQSAIKPDWSFMAQKHRYLLDEADLAETEHPNLACRDIAKPYGRLQCDQVLSFRLRANPTKRIGKDTKYDGALNGKRVGLLREEEQIAWLRHKGQERETGKPGGFEILMREVEDRNGEVRLVPRVNVRCEGKQRTRKKEEGRSHEMTHLAVRFDGLLRITDATAFRETLATGIGAAKAFGFGMLSVAPPG